MTISQREFNTPNDTSGMTDPTEQPLSCLRNTLMERLFHAIRCGASDLSIEHQAIQIRRIWQSLDQIGGAR